MNKLSIAFLIVMLALFFGTPASMAEDFPAQSSQERQPQQRFGTEPQVFQGYVPPPPIRHTWPGGYKVIFHEMMNTLMEHITGQY